MANVQRDSEKERRWREVLGRQAASGLSVREFCKRERLTESQFYAWRRTIAERDGESGPSFVPVVVSDQPSRVRSGVSRIAPLTRRIGAIPLRVIAPYSLPDSEGDAALLADDDGVAEVADRGVEGAGEVNDAGDGLTRGADHAPKEAADRGGEVASPLRAAF